MVRIQLYILKIFTQTNFSVSAQPILNPRGGPPTHGPQESPPEPNNRSKHLQKTSFLSPFLSD